MSKGIITRRTALTLEAYGANVSKVKREAKLKRDRELKRSGNGHKSVR